MLLELLKKRTSIRNFTGEVIESEKIEYILEAGRLSPSGGNEQAWKFGVITDKDLIMKISEIAYNQTWIANASFLIVLCTCLVEKERGAREIQKKRFPRLSKTFENMDDTVYGSLNMEEYQTKIPGTHMAMAALEQGIGSTWVSYFDVEMLSQLLKLPKACMASEVLAFGYPIQEKEPRNKKSLEEITFYNIFN